MKTLAVSVILTAAFAAPAFADPTPKADAPVNVAPVTATEVTETDAQSAEEALDVLQEATTQEARRIQMVRCSGPPMPRKDLTAESIKKMLEERATELAAMRKAASDPVSGR